MRRPFVGAIDAIELVEMEEDGDCIWRGSSAISDVSRSIIEKGSRRFLGWNGIRDIIKEQLCCVE